MYHDPSVYTPRRHRSTRVLRRPSPKHDRSIVSPRDTMDIAHPRAMPRAWCATPSTTRRRTRARICRLSRHIYTHHILRSAAAATTLERLLALVATDADRAATEEDARVVVIDALIVASCACIGVCDTVVIRSKNVRVFLRRPRRLRLRLRREGCARMATRASSVVVRRRPSSVVVGWTSDARHIDHRRDVCATRARIYVLYGKESASA